MSELFKNAKFGDKFKTRDGRCAEYKQYHRTSRKHILFAEDGECIDVYNDGCVYMAYIDEREQALIDRINRSDSSMGMWKAPVRQNRTESDIVSRLEESE